MARKPIYRVIHLSDHYKRGFDQVAFFNRKKFAEEFVEKLYKDEDGVLVLNEEQYRKFVETREGISLDSG